MFAFIAIAIAVTMAVLDSTIVNVALPAISQDLQVSPAQAIWVINAYQLAVTVALLPLASLGDILGYKRIYLSGLVIFTLASFACANAHTLLFLSCARALQGLGAAGIMSVNIALVRFIYPKAQLGIGVGYASLVVATASAAGPSIASAILTFAHWQWLFLVNVLLGLLALLIGRRALPITPASGNKFNILSSVLNALTFGLIISGCAAFSEYGATLRGATMILAGVLFGVFFVWRENRLAMPILPLDLLRLPVFPLSMMASICAFAAQTMTFIALPFYFEQVLARSAIQTGLLMTPWPLMTALIAPIAGRLSDRFAPGKLCTVGLLVMTTGLASFSLMGTAPSFFDIGWRLAICGLGFGLFQSPNNRIIMSNAPRTRSGGASGLQSMGRLLGQSIGAVIVALMFGLAYSHQTIMITRLASALGVMAACFNSLRQKNVRA
jgi:DHA2 family multidrug resistance protein-like MFS transporter